MINFVKKYLSENTGILIRLDDIAENMNWPLMKKCELLFDKYNIFTVAIDYANVKGCRISPNIFTTTEELDTFVEAVKEMSLV